MLDARFKRSIADLVHGPFQHDGGAGLDGRALVRCNDPSKGLSPAEQPPWFQPDPRPGIALAVKHAARSFAAWGHGCWDTAERAQLTEVSAASAVMSVPTGTIIRCDVVTQVTRARHAARILHPILLT